MKYFKVKCSKKECSIVAVLGLISVRSVSMGGQVIWSVNCSSQLDLISIGDIEQAVAAGYLVS